LIEADTLTCDSFNQMIDLDANQCSF